MNRAAARRTLSPGYGVCKCEAPRSLLERAGICMRPPQSDAAQLLLSFDVTLRTCSLNCLNCGQYAGASDSAAGPAGEHPCPRLCVAVR
jgi:hypothetical protein